jgi:dienelactone hydrolase
MKLVLALALAALVAVPAASGYRNPTAGRVLVLQMPGMHRAKVRRGVVYRTADGTRLRMDVYRPRRARGLLPVVLLGGPPGAGRTTGQKMGWAQLIAASGMAAVAFDIRSDLRLNDPEDPSTDVAAAIAYVRARARSLGIDRDRMCTLGFSIGTAPWHLWATMKQPQPYVRCNVVFYGQLDFVDSEMQPADAAEYSALTYLRRDGPHIPPMLIAKAGRDRSSINESIDRFAAAARAAHADVRVVTNANAGHAFDLGTRTARAKTIVREALRFLRARLAPPLRFRDGCGTPQERASALRFFATDDTRLIGLALGSGDRGVVLAHEIRASLCNRLPFARELVSHGYRVLAYDSRSGGSSGSSGPGSEALDVVAAVEALYRDGVARVAVGGASLGGAAAIVGGSALPEPPAGVFSLSAPANFGRLAADDAVLGLRVPILFVAAEGDGTFADDARALYGRSGSGDRTLAIVPGAAHGTQMLEDPAVDALVTQFIEHVLA